MKLTVKLHLCLGLICPWTLSPVDPLAHRPPQGDRSEGYVPIVYIKLNFEVQNLFIKDPEAGGVIFPKYEPVASHTDPKSARNSRFRTLRKLMWTHTIVFWTL